MLVVNVLTITLHKYISAHVWEKAKNEHTPK